MAKEQQVATQVANPSSVGVKLPPEKTIADQVLDRVAQMQSENALDLPKDYSAANALKCAYLEILEVKDRNGKAALEVCTKTSIANALLKMVVQGLNPVKKQAYFVVMGDQLTMMKSYHGSKSQAMRCGMKSVFSHCIYVNDVYRTTINPHTGAKTLVQHESPFENRDINKIQGAYAIVSMNDGSCFLEEMTILEIRKAWQQGAAKGNSPAHQNFTDEMAKKTVEQRAFKRVVNSSDDANLDINDDEFHEEGTVRVINQPKAQSEKPILKIEEKAVPEQAITKEPLTIIEPVEPIATTEAPPSGTLDF